MENKKLSIIGIICIVCFIVLVGAIQITNFSGYGNSENLTFTGDENISRNLTIPYNALVNSAVMNLSSYKISEGTYTLDSFDTAGSGNAVPVGITQNGTYFWITDRNDVEVYKYYMNGTYTGDHWDTAGSGNAAIQGITQNGTYFWLVDTGDDEVYKYYMNGTYTGDHWDTAGSGNANLKGITQNGTYFWTLDRDDDEVYKYYMNGTYTGDHWDTAGSGNIYLNGITQNGNYFWITDILADEVYKYYMNGTYTGDHWDTAGSGSGSPYGITQNGNYFWITDYSDGEIYKYYQDVEITNPYIQINKTNIWNHTGEFNSTFSPNKTNDFASVLNSALNGGLCDCNGCVLSGTNCLIENLFHSDEAGILEYSAIDINYTPAPFPILESPSNNSYSPSTKIFNCLATDEEGLTNLTFYFWNSTGDLNLSTTLDLTGTSNSTTYSMTFNSTDTFTWGCSAFNNNSRSWWADDNFTINVDIESPIINSLSPTNDSWDNLDSNVTFYYTPTHSVNSIDTCKLYTNWIGSWTANQTDSSIDSNVQNNFTINLSSLSDATYKWTVWCNTTITGNSAYSQSGNYTIKIDSTLPNVTIILPTNSSSASGSTQTVTYSTTDTNIDTCYFTLKDSNGTIHNYAENTSLNCSATTRSISVLAYDTYTLYIYSDDKAENTGTDQVTFTLTEPEAPTGGGGGGAGVSQISVVIVKETENVRTLTDLQRAIIYSKIYELQEDGLTIEEKTQIIEDLKEDSIILTITELTLLYNQIIAEKIENIKVSQSIADRYNLIRTVLVYEFQVVPRILSGEVHFVCAKVGGEIKQFRRPIKANKLFDSCEVTQGNWRCEVSEDKLTAYVIYDFKEPDFFIQTLEGEIKYISHDGEVDYTRVISMNIINVCQEIDETGILVIYPIILGVVVLGVGGFILYRKRKNYKGSFLKKGMAKLKKVFTK